MGVARGWVAGRAGLWRVRPTRVWVGGTSPEVPEHPTSICDAVVKASILRVIVSHLHPRYDELFIHTLLMTLKIISGK